MIETMLESYQLLRDVKATHGLHIKGMFVCDFDDDPLDPISKSKKQFHEQFFICSAAELNPTEAIIESWGR